MIVPALPAGVLLGPSLVHCFPDVSQPVYVIRSTPVVTPVISPAPVLAPQSTPPNPGVSSVTVPVVDVYPGPGCLSYLPFLALLALTVQLEFVYSPFFWAAQVRVGPGFHSYVPLLAFTGSLRQFPSV